MVRLNRCGYIEQNVTCSNQIFFRSCIQKETGPLCTRYIVAAISEVD
jgi:hypothetical protein